MQTEIDRAYQVRPAGPDDVGELVRMQIALQQSMERIDSKVLHLDHRSSEKLHVYYQGQMQDPHAQILVARHEESAQIVGMGAGKIWLHTDYLPPRSGEFIDVWVDPGHRRRGLAGRMIASLLRFFQAHGIEFLAVNYIEGNALAETLWKKLEFKPVVITAATDRARVETALGISSRRIIPIAYRSTLASKRAAYAGVTNSR